MVRITKNLLKYVGKYNSDEGYNRVETTGIASELPVFLYFIEVENDAKNILV